MVFNGDASSVVAELQKILAQSQATEKAFAGNAKAAENAAKSINSVLKTESATIGGLRREVESLRGKLQQVGTETHKAGAAFKASGTSSGQFRANLNQVTFAIDDFSSTVGTTGLAGGLRAVSNNLSTLATGFGPMVGLFTGLGLAAAQLLIPKLMGVSDVMKIGVEETDKFKDTIKELGDEYEKLTRTQENYEDLQLRLQKVDAESNLQMRKAKQLADPNLTEEQRDEVKLKAAVDLLDLRENFDKVERAKKDVRRKNETKKEAETHVSGRQELPAFIKQQFLAGADKEAVKQQIMGSIPANLRGGAEDSVMRLITAGGQEAAKQDEAQSKPSFWQKKAVENLQEKERREKGLFSEAVEAKKEQVKGLRGKEQERGKQELALLQKDQKEVLGEFVNQLREANAKLKAFTEEEETEPVRLKPAIDRNANM